MEVAGGVCFQESQPGKETCGLRGALHLNQPGAVALGLKEQQPKHQISQLPVAAGRQYADIPQVEGTFCPPDPASAAGDIFIVYHHVPGGMIQFIAAQLKNLLPDGQRILERTARRKPFTLNHTHLNMT